jgi:hypothetical protein
MGRRPYNFIIAVLIFFINFMFVNSCFPGKINVVPAPQSIKIKNFTTQIRSDWTIITDIPDEESPFLSSYLNGEFQKKIGISLNIGKCPAFPSKNYIFLVTAKSNQIKQVFENQNLDALDSVGEEGYILDIFDNSISIVANNRKGIFYGIQTLLQLTNGSRQDAYINAATIIDYPKIKKRGIHFSGPDIRNMKEYLDKMAYLKLNVAIIESQDYFDLINKDKDMIYENIFEYARKRNIEPIPELASFGTGTPVLEKDPLAAEGIFLRDIKFKFLNGEARSENPAQFRLINVIKGGNCDIQVKSAKTGEIYREGTDYIVIKGELKFPYSPDNFPTRILQKNGGRIRNGENVLVSYDYVENKCASWAPWSIPYCPSYEGTYEIMSQAIEETIDRLHPSYLSIGHDEIRGMNRDSRCIKRNLTNAQLLGYDINRLYSIARSIDEKITLLMWSDMLDPLYNGGKDHYQIEYGGKKGRTASAIDLIPKDIIVGAQE